MPTRKPTRSVQETDATDKSYFINHMNLKSTGLTNWFAGNADMVNVTMTSSLRHAEPSVSSSIQGEPGHGCLVLEQSVSAQKNPESIVSKETEFWISMITAAGFTPLLFLLGFPGNILSAAVFYRQGLRERINFCVFCLAVVDLVVITVSLILSIERIHRTFNGVTTSFKYFAGLAGLAGVNWISMFLSTVVAAERCFCVVSPLRAQRMLSTRTLAVVILVISLVLLVSMAVITGPKHTLACVFDPRTQSTSLIIYVTEYYLANKEILDIFDIFVFATALPSIFFVVVVVTTIVTAVKLHSAVKWRLQSSSASANAPTRTLEDNMVTLTRMLIATSALFAVTLAPILLVQLMMFAVPDLQFGARYHNLTAVLWNIVPVFRCVNSSLNFFIYYYMGSRFRLTLKQLLSCKNAKTVHE